MQRFSGVFLLILTFSLMAPSMAGDLVTKSGKKYKNYALMGAAPNGIRVFHEDGIVILQPSDFPDELKEVVAKIAKDIPAARKAFLQRVKERKARKAARLKKAKAEAARNKKSAALYQKEASQEKKMQSRLKKVTPAPSMSGLAK